MAKGEPAKNQPNAGIDDSAQSRIDRTSRRFRIALTSTVGKGSGDAVEIADYLPKESESAQLRAAMLEALVVIDLEVRHAHGQKPKVESYLLRFPELLRQGKPPVVLLVAEFNARKLTGEQIDKSEFRKRFPEVYDRFNETLSNHEYRTMESGSFDSGSDRAPIVNRHLTQSSAASVGFGGHASQFGSAGYQLVRKIGQGAYGEVWRAEAPGGVDVAIKMVVRPLTDQGYRREHEALELVKRLRHPFLLQTHAYWSEPDRLIVATELADCSLQDRLDECREAGMSGIPIEELCGYLRQAALALDFLGSKEILHRDIKPANILIVNGHAKVADFGVARAVPKDDPVGTEESGTRSNMGATVIGTPNFMSPEVWQSSFSKHIDQYSLAVAYAQLRTGKAPFVGDDLRALMFLHVMQAPKLEGLPEAEKQVVLKALSKKPDDRYPSCIAFVEAIEKATGLVKEVRVPRWPFYAAAGVLGLLAIAWSANWFVHRHDFSVVGDDVALVEAGSSTTLRMNLTARSSAREPPKIEVDGLPAGVEFRTESVESNPDAMLLRFSVAELDFDVGKFAGTPRPLELRVIRNGVLRTKRVQLEVARPTFAGQEFFDPVPGARFLRVAGGRVFASKVALKDKSKFAAKPVHFIAIIETERPFYLMENKVWNDLYERFANDPANRTVVQQSRWKEGALANRKPLGVAGKGDLPIFNVTALEAAAFANWLLPGKGTLPSHSQWSAAAAAGSKSSPGKPPRRGPYDPAFNPVAADAVKHIAIARAELGPLPVGAATLDRTPLGLADMAGNGQEWTATVQNSSQNTGVIDYELRADTKPNPGDSARIVGAEYYQESPWEFTGGNQFEDIGKPSHAISFRVAYVP